MTDLILDFIVAFNYVVDRGEINWCDDNFKNLKNFEVSR